MIQFDSYVSNGLKFHQLGMLNTELHTMDVMNTSLPQDEIRQCFEGFQLAEAIFGTMGTRVYLMDHKLPKLGDDLKPCGKPMGTFVRMMIQSAQFDASIFWQSNFGSDFNGWSLSNVTAHILLDYLEPESNTNRFQQKEALAVRMISEGDVHSTEVRQVEFVAVPLGRWRWRMLRRKMCNKML